MNDRIGSAAWYKAKQYSDWRSCHLLAWSTNYMELLNGTGQFPVGIVEDDLTGEVKAVPVHLIRFKNPE